MPLLFKNWHNYSCKAFSNSLDFIAFGEAAETFVLVNAERGQGVLY